MANRHVDDDNKPNRTHARAVTSRDVAQAAGVSQSLVSLVLSEKPGKKIRPETRERVLAAASSLGYRPNLQARAMRLRKARTIGLLSTWDTGSFVFPPVVNGLKDICDREGLALMICTGRKDAAGIPDYVAYHLENRIDGLVYLSHVGVTREGVVGTLSRAHIPFVCAIGAKDLEGITSVDVDFVQNGRLAAQHLWEAGCRRPVACIRASASYAERERFEGFAEVFRAAGCAVAVLDPTSCGVQPEERILAFRDFLCAHPETDGFAGVTELAWQMLTAAGHAKRRVPEDFRVISMDNDTYAPYLTPSLSTVDEPLEDIGRTAGELLLRVMNGSPPGEKVALPLSVSARESSGSAAT